MIHRWWRVHRRLSVGVAALGIVLVALAYLQWPAMVGSVGLVGSSAGLVLAAVVNNWETVERVGGRALGTLGFVSGAAERAGLAAQMQGVINGARRDLADEVPGAMPFPARVRFVRNEEDLVRLHDGEVVISLRNPSHTTENAARAMLGYVSTGTIRVARPYVAPDVLTGLDYSLTKRLLAKTDQRALDYFLNEMWASALREAPQLSLICDEIETIERGGLLDRIVVSELLELGRRLYPAFTPPNVQEETREFVSHLAWVADKEADDEETDPDFRRRHIRIGVVLVGERTRAEQEGARLYVNSFLWKVDHGCRAIYILGRGARCDLVRQVVAQVERDGRVRDAEISEYEWSDGVGRRVPAVCARVIVEPTAARASGRGGVTRQPRSGSAA